MHLSWLICITKSKLVSEESAPLTSVSHWSFSAVAVLKSKMTSHSGPGGVPARFVQQTGETGSGSSHGRCSRRDKSLPAVTPNEVLPEQMTFRGKGSREERELQGQIWKTCYNSGAKLSYHHRRSKVVISYVVTQRWVGGTALPRLEAIQSTLRARSLKWFFRNSFRASHWL